MRALSPLCMAVVIALSAAPVATLAGPLTLFDDDYGPGWTRGTWDVHVDRENTYGGSAAALHRVGGVTLKTTSLGGLDISGTPLLQAYVNFRVSEAAPGHSLTNVKVRTTTGTLFEFDDRGAGWVCYLDGVEHRDAAEIVFDTDPRSWQLFEIDLSQVDYFGWPHQARQLGDTPITSIEFSAYGNTTGTIAMSADDIRLVPEPALVGVLCVGALALLRRRRQRGLARYA